MSLPAGLPPKHECASADACWEIVRNNYRDGAAAALYTLIRLDIDENKLDLAGKHAELYLRRFPKGKEASAVRQLRRIAGGE